MATYERSIRVDAPLEEVWSFHSTVDGLIALTPAWMNLRVESVRGPDGTADPDVLVAGSELRLSVQPFGVGPRQEWVSEITAREESETRASFRDVMVDGPFETWEHTHLFVGDGPQTYITDAITYELPLGQLGSTVSPLAVFGFEPMFRYRHRRTKALLEDYTGRRNP